MKVGVCPFRQENKVNYDVFLEIYPPSSSPTYSSYSYTVDLLHWEPVSSPFRPTLVDFLRPGLLHSVLPPPLNLEIPPLPSSPRSWPFSLFIKRKIHLFITSGHKVSFCLNSAEFRKYIFKQPSDYYTTSPITIFCDLSFKT